MRYFLMTQTQYGPDGRRVFDDLMCEIVRAETPEDLGADFVADMVHQDATKGWRPSIARQFARTAWRQGRAEIAIGRGRRRVLELGEITAVEARDANPAFLVHFGPSSIDVPEDAQ